MVTRLFVPLVLVAAALAAPAQLSSQELVTVTGRVSISTARAGRTPDPANVVVWLEPLAVHPPPRVAPARGLRIVQQNRRFHPHLLVVPVGTAVDFPNRDPFFHNVFSMYDGKRFDLGLYESGTTRSVTFTRPGASFIFCNIHPEMSAVVMAVDTPYYAVSDRGGRVTIAGVPEGRYRLFAWHELHHAARDAALPREISVEAANGSLGVIRFVESSELITPHTNKYGQEYNPPPSPSPIYRPAP
jgi:plastocyanin